MQQHEWIKVILLRKELQMHMSLFRWSSKIAKLIHGKRVQVTFALYEKGNEGAFWNTGHILYLHWADKVLPRQSKVKGVHHHRALVMWNVKGTYLRKRRRSKVWRVKWQQTHNYQQLNLKNKNKLSKQLEQE